MSAFEAGDLDRSLAWTRMAARRVPQNRIAHLIEADLLARLGRPGQEASEAYHAELLQPHRIPADAMLGTGMGLFQLGMTDLAMSALESGVSATNQDDRVPGEPMARIYIGLADYMKKEHEMEEEAVRVLSMSTRIHPTPLACNRLAEEALERQDYEQAAEYLEQSLRLDPDQAGVHATLGQIAVKVGDPAAALRHFKRALEMDPDLEDELSPWVTVRRD